jgi:hypothetical protein
MHGDFGETMMLKEGVEFESAMELMVLVRMCLAP